MGQLPARTKPYRHYKASEIAAALQAARTMLGAARLLGCSRSTVERWVKKSPLCRAALHDVREELIDTSEERLAALVEEGDTWAIGLVLQTIGRARGWGKAQEINLQGEPRRLTWDDTPAEGGAEADSPADSSGAEGV